MAGDFSKSRLAGYQKQWRARLGKELQVGYWAHRFYEKLDNRQIEHLYNFVADNGISRFVAESDDFSFDWHGELVLNVLKHLAVNIPTKIAQTFSRRATIKR